MVVSCTLFVRTTHGGLLEDSGIKGGLVVSLGWDDASRDALMEAAATGPYLVQFLDTDAGKVEQARGHIQMKDLYGRVSANVFDGENLPYINDLVNMIVASGEWRVAGDEIARVLVPRGTALARAPLKPETGNLKPESPAGLKGWHRYSKQVPPEIDEWSHWMHGPDNNPVAKDTKIDVPRNLQWVHGPNWISSHNLNPGVSAVVCSGGRVFSIINEMPPGIKGRDDKWVLTARGAFNGLVLWARPIKEWGWTHWSEKEESVEMRFVPPFQVMRRLVAAQDMLFVTPGFYSPVHVLDAATGEELRVIEGTEKTFEILHAAGKLYLAVNESIGTDRMIPAISVRCANPKTGEIAWKTGGFRGISGKLNSLYKHANVFITAGSGNITLLNGDELVSLDQETGKEKWRRPRPGRRVRLSDEDINSLAPRKTRSANVPKYRADQFFPNNCAIAHSDGVIVLTEIKDDPKNMKTRLGKTGYTAAYDAVSGKELWRFDCVTFAHFTPPDVFVINGLVWTLDGETRSYVGLDLRTGRKKRSYPVEDMIWKAGGHQLCFRNKATTEMIIFGRRKTEFIDIRTGEISKHAWIKGMCNYGVMPAYGMIYYPPHNCSCYMPIKNTGFRAQTAQGYTGGEKSERLLKGKAYGRSFVEAGTLSDAEWPIYRADAARRGSLRTSLPEEPALKWSTELRAPLSQVIAVGDRLYVAERDAHGICCLRKDDGKVQWRYTAGGRIDSAPTYCDGRLVAGCRDGHVYCLDAKTGELVWRFRGAPHEAGLVAYGQVESVWPVHGSMIVEKGKVYCLAGRSSHLNGGMHLCTLDLETGEVLKEKKLVPNLDSNYESEEAARSDLMVVDGDAIRVRHMEFNRDDIGTIRFGKGASRGPTFPSSISTFSGFLDESWFNTTVWALGSARGQVMAYDDTHVFGLLAHKKFGQSCGHDIFRLAGDGYLLFCKSTSGKGDPTAKKQGQRKGRKTKGAKPAFKWSTRVPLRGEAMLLGDNCLYVAGTRDIVDEKNPWAHVEGAKGGVMAVYSREDGRTLAEVPLSSRPAFDGMSASKANVFLVTEDGRVSCYE